MDETLQVNLLRNVQPTDRKLSVSREFVGPKKRQERLPIFFVMVVPSSRL